MDDKWRSGHRRKGGKEPYGLSSKNLGQVTEYFRGYPGERKLGFTDKSPALPHYRKKKPCHSLREKNQNKGKVRGTRSAPEDGKRNKASRGGQQNTRVPQKGEGGLQLRKESLFRGVFGGEAKRKHNTRKIE